jgi:nicotinate-nucleotide adenylyltransferase
MRIAIFGGTFDPIHEAHLAVARAAAARFQLDRVLVVPAGSPPHKGGYARAPYEDRFRMAELACSGDGRLEASRLEEGSARSYSIDTIERVRAAAGAETELFFLIGADAFAEIGSWRRWQDVVRAVTFIVASRPGAAYDTPAGSRVERLDTLDIDVSSSAIRAELASGREAAGLPPAVAEYIYTNGLYGASRR